MTLITLLLIAILVALLVQITDARKRQREEHLREEQRRQAQEEDKRRQAQEEDKKPRRRVAVQVLVIGDELRALDAEGRQWTWDRERWWALNHLMLPQAEDDQAWNLFALKHDDKLRDFLPIAKARYDAGRAEPFPISISRPSDEVNAAIREFVAGLKEPEELREALEREVTREFYQYLKRKEERQS